MRGTAARYRIVATAVLGFVIAGCDGITGNKERSIAITVDNADVSVGQGSRDSILVTITRTNFDQPITLSVEGTLPVGVTRTFTSNPLPAGATQTYLHFVATGTATPGSATLTVRATGDGVPDKEQPIELTVTVTGTYTLGLLSSSLTVAQGGGGDATVLLTRSEGNGSGVALDVTGAPAGVTASVASPVTGRAATLSVTAAASVSPGTYPITITSSAAGFTSDQTTQLSLVVISPPSTASISIPFCSTFLPIWFAYQNEGFGWQRVTATGSAFAFAATQKVAIAYVFQAGNEFQSFVFLASRGELSGFSDRDCDGPRTITGSVTGLTAGQSGIVRMGVSADTTTTGPFTLPGVVSRPIDLVATRGTITPVAGFLTDDLVTPDKLIVRRGLDLTGSIPPLDFTAAEAFAPTTSNLTVSSFSTGFNIQFFNTLFSATATYGLIQVGQVPGGTTTFSSVPVSQLATGDLHELYAEAFQSDFLVGHGVVSYFAAPADRTETLGPLLPGPVVSMVSTTPYARLRGQLSSQSEYNTAAQFYLQQGDGQAGNRRIVVLVGTTAHYGTTPGTWDLVLPDFSGVQGFASTWMPTPGQPLSVYYAQAYAGREDLLFGALPNAGESFKFAYRVVNTATLLPLRAANDFRPLRVPRRSQYLRR